MEKLIRKAYPQDKKINRSLWVYRYYREKLHKHYIRISQPSPAYGDFGWLRNPEAYRYIRLMYDQGRIAIVEGDLLKDRAMRSIAKASRELGSPMRIYYPSNAEEMWQEFPLNYRINVMSMPFDERSVALRTIWANKYPPGRKQRFWHPLTPRIYWHYVVHGALDYQKKIQFPDYHEVDDWKYERLPTKSPDTQHCESSRQGAGGKQILGKVRTVMMASRRGRLLLFLPAVFAVVCCAAGVFARQEEQGPLILQEMTWQDVRDYLKTNDMVIIPLGSTEQQGPHLPLGTDLYEAFGISKIISSKTGVIVAPLVHVGYSEIHMGFPGTVTVRPETLEDLLFQSAESLIRHGFRKFLFFNYHGGNNIVQTKVMHRINHSTPATALAIGIGGIHPEGRP